MLQKIQLIHSSNAQESPTRTGWHALLHLPPFPIASLPPQNHTSPHAIERTTKQINKRKIRRRDSSPNVANPAFPHPIGRDSQRLTTAVVQKHTPSVKVFPPTLKICRGSPKYRSFVSPKPPVSFFFAFLPFFSFGGGTWAWCQHLSESVFSRSLM